MKRSTRSVVSIVVVLSVLLFVIPAASAAAPPDPASVYTARTADGVTLALKRYRPDPVASFRAGAQPLILTPGFFCNINYFDVHTPEFECYRLRLPDVLAPWAAQDPYVQQDPMRYYSMAHYLWTQGYDVWLANYRAEGRVPYRSGGASGYSIDELAIYDVPAIVSRVFEVTGQHPVWFGHSMGSSMIYGYLEGARFGSGWNPHVVSDPALAAERNGGNGPQSLKALVDLDGPMVPVGANVPDINLLFRPLNIAIYLNLRPITKTLGEPVTPVVNQVNKLMWAVYSMLGMPDMGFLNMMMSMNSSDMDPTVTRYLLEYCVDGGSTRIISQYADSSCHKKFREDFKNGAWNCVRRVPPRPKAGDGYYYYTDNLTRISLPALVIADSTDDVTSPWDIENFYKGKARNGFDEFYLAPNTAHVDVVNGLSAPGVTFPKIGAWLAKALAK